MTKQKQEEIKEEKLSEQVKKSVASDKKKKPQPPKPPEGNFANVISTGSTLLDLAISGGKVRGGGIPGGGLFIEIFGPPSVGKTSMLCEIAGNVKRKGGELQFHDPEARLSKTFAKHVYDLELFENEVLYPNTPDDVFNEIWKWNPEDVEKINGIFIDSTAALASDLEMENKKDEYQRRAKLFSQGFRKAARLLKQNNYIMVCSNQIREKMDAGFGERIDTPGGQAMKFYSSLRLRVFRQRQPKLERKITYKGKEEKQPFAIAVYVEVYKSSVWEPYHKAPVYIDFKYGIDDIRANLEYVKKWTNSNIYYVEDTKLSNSMDNSITIVEDNNLEEQLKNQVINIWLDIQNKMQFERKKKKR
jgi:recombination protein RecA